MGFLARDIGVDVNDLQDSTTFENLGVDSLIAVGIASRMREDFEIDAGLSLFRDYPTIGLFKSYLARVKVPPRTQGYHDMGASTQSHRES